MSSNNEQNEQSAQLNIPSFLLSPTFIHEVPSREEIEEDEVEAMMKSVLRAADAARNDAQDDEQGADADAPQDDAQSTETTAPEDSDEGEDAPSAEEPSEDAPSADLEETPEENESNSEPEPEPAPAQKGQSPVDNVAFLPMREPEEPSLIEEHPEPTEEAQSDSVAPNPEPSDEPTPTLEEDLQTMKRVERHLFAYRYATTELETYGASIDPIEATDDRSEALAVLAEEEHALLNDPQVGPALDRIIEHADELDSIVVAQAKMLARDRHRVVSVPAPLRARLVRLTSEAYDVWVRARKENDWQLFAPYLDRIVKLRRTIALAQAPDAHPYDTLLDEYEPETDRAFYDALFSQIKQCVVPLLSAISMSKRTLNSTCVKGHFDTGRQWDLADNLCLLMGINEDAHFLTSTEHPFSDAMTSHYAVTAAHVEENDLMSNIFTMLHELGHGLYEQGVNPAFNRTSLKGGTSFGMHEAQARFFENYVGRDRAFMVPLLELMRYHFPGQLSRATPNQLFQAVNHVTPSLIRVDADELTYPLHVLVRYEIEQLLFDQKISAREVPQLWAERYESYIGARPTNDAQGALQDVHWAMGDFGYFPAYVLGNAYAAQLRAKMIQEGMDWQKTLRSGDLSPIRSWLGDHIWKYGRSKSARELIQDACGEPFDVSYYTRYLTGKFSYLYNLQQG